MRRGAFITLGLALGLGCFSPALPRDDDADTHSDTRPPDTVDPDIVAPDTLSGADTAEVEVPTECTVDDDCVALANPPCVVGRCVAERCTAANVSVPCDDGDVCTTADQCSGGVCKGRAFTVEESKSWIAQLGGRGVQQVVGHVTHPSGHVTVVGAFDEELRVAGQTLVSAGGFDGFVVRLSATGALVSASRFGSAETDDSPLFVASEGEHIGVVWATLPIGEEEPRRFYAVRATDTHVGDGTEVSGEPIALDTLPGGDLLLSARVRGTVQIPLVGGGTVAFSDSTDTTAYLMRLSEDGATWVVGATDVRLGSDSEVVFSQYVAAVADQVIWSLTSLDGGRVGATLLERSGQAESVRHHVTLAPATGAVMSQEVVDLGPPEDERVIYFGARYERSGLVETHLPVDGDNPNVYGVKRASHQCTIEMGPRLTRFSGAESDGVLALIATEQGGLDLGSGVVVPAGPHVLALARYDAECRAQAATSFLLPPVADVHPISRRLGVHRVSKGLDAGARGRAFVAMSVRGYVEPGGPFGAAAFSVDGYNDGVVGSIGPTDLYQCVPSSD